MKLNNLLVCIGAQKSGTSWLHNVLSKDKRFKCASNQFENVKEIHYFDYLYDNNAIHINKWRAHYLTKMILNRKYSMETIVADWLHKESAEKILRKYKKIDSFMANRFLTLVGDLNDDWYANILKCNGEQLYSLDITPDYSVIGKTGFSHLGNIAKNVKMLFILRDPVERAWSGVLQAAKGKPGGIDSFIKNKPYNIDQLYKECTIGLDIGQRTNYEKTLDDIKDAKQFEKLKILFYDDIAQNPEKFIDNIYDFIEVDNMEIKTREYKNELHKRVYQTVGKEDVPKELEIKLINYYRNMLLRIQEKHKVKFPEAWRNKYEF